MGAIDNYFNEFAIGSMHEGVARIITKRNLGNISFWKTRFNEMDVQFVLSKKNVSNYKKFTKLSLGSLVRVKGEKIITQNGTHSLSIKEIEVIHECSYPWINKHQGINPELRYRNRTLDLIVTDDAFLFCKNISDSLGVIRSYLALKGYREFGTGVLQSNFEAGQASAFKTFCNANNKEMSLSLTSELKLKRLIAGGFEKVYEIAQSFRNEGIDSMHSPEFTLLEIYSTSSCCEDMMHLVEELTCNVISKVNNDVVLKIEDVDEEQSIVFSKPFCRLKFGDAFKRYVEADECSLEALINRYPGMFKEDMTTFTWLMKVIEKLVVPNIIQPTFLTELPADMSPFAKKSSDGNTERAFFIARNLFIADIYTDENDSQKIEEALMQQSKKTGRPINKDYLTAMKLGMPPTAGIGMGLNRLFMIFLKGLPINIKETIVFPIV